MIGGNQTNAVDNSAGTPQPVAGDRGRVEILANAKINLSLDVLYPRDDGYHELRSVIQMISLYDHLELWLGERTSRKEAEDLTLIDKAIDSTLSHLGSTATVDYRVRKSIPVAAGLGGGSSDAAAAIRATCFLLDASPSSDELARVALGLGSDVPYFLTGGTCLVEGRGERVTRLTPAPKTWLVLAGPGTAVSTKQVFERYHPDDASDEQATAQVLRALGEGGVVFGGNDLTSAATREFPEIDRVFSILRGVAPDEWIGMTGSGGSVAALFETEEEARRAEAEVRPRVAWAATAEFVESMSRPSRVRID